jgi:hypothetical protein
LGDINKIVVEHEMDTLAFGYPDPRPEDGYLEHGLTGTKIPTQVYRGNGEPKQDQIWTSMMGSVYVGDSPLRIDLTVRSAVSKSSEGYEYVYDVRNLADALIAVWNSVDVPFFRSRLEPLGRSFPVVLRGETDRVQIRAVSKSPPAFTRGDLLILSKDRREAFRINAPAYLPK